MRLDIYSCPLFPRYRIFDKPFGFHLLAREVVGVSLLSAGTDPIDNQTMVRME